MKRADETVKKETVYIAAAVIILSALMQSVFLILRRWDYTVLLGNLLSGGVAVLNFFLMGYTIQCASDKDSDKSKTFIRGSQALRTVLLFAVAALGVGLNCFNSVAVIVPLFFPRIAAGIRPVFMKKE